MKMILLDRNENWIGNVQGAIIAERQAEINGHDLLLLETLSELEKGQRIVYQDEQNYWHEYIVREVKKRHDSGLQYSIYCESSFYELLGDYIEDKRPTNTTATAALSIALEPTRWQVGQVDDLGLHSTNFYQISAKEAVSKIAGVWKGEIRTRITVVGNQITGRYVDLKSLIGNDLGKRFSYDKDMHAITKTVARADVITALYGYGRGEEVGDGYGRRLRFGEINDGVDYVENLDAKAIWGRLNPDGSRSHVFGKETFDDIENMVELKAKTEDKLVELSQPMISYTADVLDLKAAGFDHEGVGLGDTCLIIDKEFEPELRISGRVIAVVEDLIGKRKTITLGNYLPIITDSISKQEAFIDSFRARSSVWDRSGSFGEDGKLSTSFIDGAIDVLKNQLLSVQSGWYTDDSGNLVLDAINGESSMMLSGAGFMIANTKLPNGEWDYRTFGTGYGFTADMIIAGALVGGNVAWNLEDGTLLIGESTEDYQLYFDGTDLHFGEGVAVTWSTLSGKPTYLGSDRISSPEIYGGNIYGGNIYGGTITSGSTIDVTTDLKVGDNVYVGGTDTTRMKGVILGGIGSIYAYNDEIALNSQNIVMQTRFGLFWEHWDSQSPIPKKTVIDYYGDVYADYLGGSAASAYKKSSNFRTGVVEISTTANTNVSKYVSFGTSFSSAPQVVACLAGTVPSRFQGPSVQNITTSGFDVYIRDTTTGTAYVRWIAVL